MKRAIENGEIVEEELDEAIQRAAKLGQCLLRWIHAYANAPGNARSCWVGEKKIVGMTWQDPDSSDDEE